MLLSSQSVNCLSAFCDLWNPLQLCAAGGSLNKAVCEVLCLNFFVELFGMGGWSFCRLIVLC